MSCVCSSYADTLRNVTRSGSHPVTDKSVNMDNADRNDQCCSNQ